jgi:hypothetical protein
VKLPFFAGLVFALLLGLAAPAHAWDERQGGDMPWLGSGGRAHYYTRDSSCWGCTTGFRHEQRWGRNAWFGEDPYITVGNAMAFLDSVGGFAGAAGAAGQGSAYVGGRRCHHGQGIALPLHRGDD